MKKVISLLLVGFLALGSAACGKADESSVSSIPSEADVSELLYVPEYFEAGEDAESIYMNGAVFNGEELCYPVSVPGGDGTAGTGVIRCVSLTKETTVDISLPFDVFHICDWTMGDDGSLYVLKYIYDYEGSADLSGMGRTLLKYDRLGNQVFSQDISGLFTGKDVYKTGCAVDGKGRFCLFQDDGVRLFDETGNLGGSISLSSGAGGEINGFCRGSDGKVYAVITDNSSTGSDATLYQINYETQKLVAAQEGLSNFGRYMLGQDASESLLISDSTSLFRCYLQSGEKEEILKWSDCGLDGILINSLSMLSDGRIAVFCRDWQSQDIAVALLSGISRAEAPQKQEIVIAQLYPDQDLSAAAGVFNGKNESYHVTINSYLKDYGASQEEIEAAKTRMVADIVSGNGPDLLNTSGLYNEMEDLISMGVFEDLNPYLDRSDVLDREDMFESVLNAETYDGILKSVPASFDIYTYFGRSDIVGDKMGWTYEEVIALLEANPGSILADGQNRMGVLRLCMDPDSFVDWETGVCSFDSEEFKSRLEFVAQLNVPEDSAFNSGGWPSLMEKLQSGEILLLWTGISYLTDIQVVQEKFQGDVTAIGNPSTDGSAECDLLIQNTVSILAQSQVKDGAWEFIECYLTEGDDRYRYGFPNSLSKLEELIAEATECELDSSGNPILDKNGDLIPIRRMGYEFAGYRFETHVPTEREIDQVLDVIRAGTNMNQSADEIMILNIVNEEAEAFFQGQKSVDEVADIIQRRASIYVSENS